MFVHGDTVPHSHTVRGKGKCSGLCIQCGERFCSTDQIKSSPLQPPNDVSKFHWKSVQKNEVSKELGVTVCKLSGVYFDL